MSDKAKEYLRKAVYELIDQAGGYSKLTGDELIACNWANMAHEKLCDKPAIKSDGESYTKGQTMRPRVKVGGASPAQQIRMDKAARRHAKNARKGNNVIY